MRELPGRILSSRLHRHPVFIVGDGRSGTSVLLQALGRHPRILDAPGEAPLLTSMGGMVALFEFGGDTSSRYFNQSLSVPKAYLYDKLRKLSFEIAFGAHYGIKFLAKQFMRTPLGFFKKTCWAAKTFPPEVVARGLAVLYPDMKILYIIRNGIDVVHSKTKFHGFKDNHFDEHCRQWKYQVDKYTYVSSYAQALKVRHEDLVSNPNDLFSKIFLFLGFANNDGPIDFVKSTLVHPLDKSTEKGIDAVKIIADREDPSERWTMEQKEIFKSICGKCMVDNGYSINW